MSTNLTFQVALIGFSAFERSAFDSFFRLSARRAPSYARTEVLEQADVILVDTDSPQAVALLPQQLCGRALGVGTHGLPGGLGGLPRPINMMAIMKVLDARLPPMRLQQPAAASVSAAITVPAEQRRGGLTAPEAQASPLAARTDYFAALAAMQSDRHAPDPEDILVVDDSDIALRFMAQHLYRYGFRVTLCHSGEEALTRIAERHYAFVFMDVNMNGMDGYTACRRIKQHLYPAGRCAPVVVMLTSRSGTFDKLRGTLAGCDAYLTKPLQEAALLRVIGEHVGSATQHRQQHA